MVNIVVALFGVLVGAFLIYFRKSFAAHCIRGQNRTWGFRFGERTVRQTERVVLVIGIGFVGIGLLALLALW